MLTPERKSSSRKNGGGEGIKGGWKSEEHHEKDDAKSLGPYCSLACACVGMRPPQRSRLAKKISPSGFCPFPDLFLSSAKGIIKLLKTKPERERKFRNRTHLPRSFKIVW